MYLSVRAISIWHINYLMFMWVNGIYFFLLLFSLRVKATELCLIVSFLQMASSLRQQTVMAICVSLDMVQVIVIARSVSYRYNIQFLDLPPSVLKQVIKCQVKTVVFFPKGSLRTQSRRN